MAFLIDDVQERDRRLILFWLCFCAVLVFFMVILGGAVRLTGSGLSMVDWNLLMGIIPPMSEAAWQSAFEHYKQFPEYKLINSEMVLSGFKFIYLMEYAHRILGRLIGVVFILPFLFFLFTKKISTDLFPKLGFLMVLGGVQGGIGWYMVKSGLVDDPYVSQYRLTLHFMVAALIYAYMIRVITGLIPGLSLARSTAGLKGVKYAGIAALIIVLTMMATGGLVAGTKAGFIFNTFPLMGEEWIPDQLLALSPTWLNFTENPVAIQFLHRWLAVLVLLTVVYYAVSLIRLKDSKTFSFFGWALIITVILQILMGISALLMGVPVHLGVAHQGGAFVLLTLVMMTVSVFFPKFHRAKSSVSSFSH